MKLSQVKSKLNDLPEIHFKLPNGESVPSHFHITEIGLVDKNFIDCGGTLRQESKISFQLWTAQDYDHRLSTEKLKSIIELSEKHLQLQDLEVEVEYQSDTIGTYSLNFEGEEFLLTPKQTDCLAKENCGIPEQKPRVKLADLQATNTSCAPGSGCC
jgi:hypothetical protein